MKFLQYPLLCLFLFVSLQVRAGEGMWLPHLLASLNEADMKAMGMKMSAEDIYSVNKGSLKDAIVHFGGFCTGEIISSQGLILTNHHCGYSAIQSHSSIENNLLRDGFWAYEKSEELQNPGLYVQFIVSIEDVTERAFNGIKKKMSTEERQSQIDKNLNFIKSSYATDPHQEVFVRPFFKGNQYILFVTKTYNDVRLVGAPPESVGKFGHDTDNWVWPRHTGDFAMFRVYAGPDGEPADYSPNNVPLTPKHSLPISLDGSEEGDFTLVFGFPGSTNEYLPGKAVDITANQINPARIAIRESAMKVMDAAMKSDEETKIKYASKFARLANYWKKWIGESTGLERTKALDKKKEYERDLTERIARNKKLRKKYGKVLPEINSLYDQLAPYLVAQSVHSEAFSRNVEFVKLGNTVNRLVNIYENNGEEAFNQAAPRYKNHLKNEYKNVDQKVDLDVFKVLMGDYQKYMPKQFMSEEVNKNISDFMAAISNNKIKNSPSLNPKLMLKLLSDGAQLKEALAKDPVRQFVNILDANYQKQVQQPKALLDSRREALMQKYMDAQMKALPKKKILPRRE